MGTFRRSRRNKIASRNSYRDSRKARDLARRQLGLRPSGAYGKNRRPRQGSIS